MKKIQFVVKTVILGKVGRCGCMAIVVYPVCPKGCNIWKCQLRLKYAVCGMAGSQVAVYKQQLGNAS